ncbi:polysaccharide biosynthesis protein [Pseudomonas sp. TMB3-21]
MNMSVFLRKLMLYVPVKLVPAVSGIFLVFFLYKSFPAGEYVSYSVSLFCSLMAAQLCAGWVGNSFIYYYSGVGDRSSFVSNCIFVILCIAPFAALLAATISAMFVDESGVFVLVWLLCLSQIVFFFLSSICQAGFMVKQQLVAVILQAAAQIGLVLYYFNFAEIDLENALFALIAGYSVAVILMFVYLSRIFIFSNPFSNVGQLRFDLKSIFQYGGALSPWIFGMLVMAGADRLAIGYYEVQFGDSYLSLKDLFVGGGGLLSMPLLMMVHPFLIKKFRDGVFAISIIESSSSFLIVAFALLWSVLYFVGFDFFERVTGKELGASRLIIFYAFAGVFLNSAAVYFQKRLEVHRKMKLLAFLSLASALMSIGFAWVGGYFWGLHGIALGVLLAQLVYFVYVISSLYKRLSVYRCFTLPVIISSLAFLSGYLLNFALTSELDNAIWWVDSVYWLAGFSVVSIFALIKGVRWSEFMKATL